MHRHESIGPMLTLLQATSITSDNVAVIMSAAGPMAPMVKPRLMQNSYKFYIPHLLVAIIEEALNVVSFDMSELRYTLVHHYHTVVAKYDWWCFNDKEFCQQIFDYCKEITTEYLAFLNKYEIVA